MYRELNELFDLLNKEFPLSTMGPDFKGSHSLRKNDEYLQLNIWSNGLCYPFCYPFCMEENDFLDLPMLISFIKNRINQLEKEKSEKEQMDEIREIGEKTGSFNKNNIWIIL